MVKGNYLYNSDDMKVGVGSYPHALTFQKIYSSGARTQKGPLGKGWGHNFDASTIVSSDGLQGMGEDSALDAATTLVEMMVSLDLLTDAAKPLDKLVIATLGQRWFGDQLLDNTVIVRQGLNGEVFVKLPDGTYNPPPANSAKLSKNGDSSYTYETVNRDELNFNPPPCDTGSNCKISTYNHASGVQVKFTYTGADLTQVQNSLGHMLTLTNTSGRITHQELCSQRAQPIHGGGRRHAHLRRQWQSGRRRHLDLYLRCRQPAAERQQDRAHVRPEI